MSKIWPAGQNATPVFLTDSVLMSILGFAVRHNIFELKDYFPLVLTPSETRSSSERDSLTSTNRLAVTPGRCGFTTSPMQRCKLDCAGRLTAKQLQSQRSIDTHTDRTERNRPQRENKEICIRQIGWNYHKGIQKSFRAAKCYSLKDGCTHTTYSTVVRKVQLLLCVNKFHCSTNTKLT